ncbi:hypothetical protein [Novosphingobium pentaromativorans]|uniref:Antitoxin Xre/MbcA/ParS-like toxin-binding domain-containing protein n=1 Tax=Novosphingobium pentaromativorans US6-1 TaxID=1088721 RepID=G6EH80_9SPHN|nr:hypothetical protein [Novosphingobium pentaromativorans]AIT81949.1 hypothetical protein JI59_20515 [Novosphingobium pentaromativorans US6-1]EHJ59369.1 hypothetical protein NSU_3701 [Novosphingobium pentaromativorans US6-1]
MTLGRVLRDPPSPCGRQWASPPRSSQQWKRRSEVYELAFDLLGGARPAAHFLGAHDAAFPGTLLSVAMGSAHGQLMVSKLVRRLASQSI